MWKLATLALERGLWTLGGAGGGAGAGGGRQTLQDLVLATT